MLDFSERLKLEREKTGYSAEEFGILGGVGKASQYNYEKGSRKPDIEYLANIAKVGCDIQYIVTGIVSDKHLEREEIELLTLFRSANKSLKLITIQLLKIPLSEE